MSETASADLDCCCCTGCQSGNCGSDCTCAGDCTCTACRCDHSEPSPT